MSKLTIVANIYAKKDKVELVKAELMKLVTCSRKDQGCIHYDLHQNDQNPTHFFIYENWDSRELWQQHMNSQYLEDYVLATEGAVEDFDVSEMMLL